MVKRKKILNNLTHTPHFIAFLALNLIFLNLVPNFHFHHHEEETCCTIELTNCSSFQIHNTKLSNTYKTSCPIENFVDQFVSIYVFLKKFDLDIFENQFFEKFIYQSNIIVSKIDNVLLRSPPKF